MTTVRKEKTVSLCVRERKRETKTETWPDSTVSPKQMETPESEAEVLDDVENLHRLLDVAHLRLLCDDQVDVHVGVDEFAVCAAPNRALNTHQAVLLKHTHNIYVNFRLKKNKMNNITNQARTL